MSCRRYSLRRIAEERRKEDEERRATRARADDVMRLFFSVSFSLCSGLLALVK